MPAKAPAYVDPSAETALATLAKALRARRKALRLPASSVAAAAGMSRQTLERIERGEASVTIGAYINALQALGLTLKMEKQAKTRVSADEAVETVRVLEYPELRLLAWQTGSDQTLSAAEALALYERNWRHVDAAGMAPHERDLLEHLVRHHGNGVLLV